MINCPLLRWIAKDFNERRKKGHQKSSLRSCDLLADRCHKSTVETEFESAHFSLHSCSRFSILSLLLLHRRSTASYMDVLGAHFEDIIKMKLSALNLIINNHREENSEKKNINGLRLFFKEHHEGVSKKKKFFKWQFFDVFKSIPRELFLSMVKCIISLRLQKTINDQFTAMLLTRKLCSRQLKVHIGRTQKWWLEDLWWKNKIPFFVSFNHV